MSAVVTKMSANGRMTVPASIRAAVGLKHGGDVIIEVVGGELRVRTVAQAMERARAAARKILGGKKGGTVEDFLADRRREASREA